MTNNIHKTAIISKKAQLAGEVTIGPYCIIGDGVVINKGSNLISNVVAEGATEIGENCTIHPFATIGLPPQDLKYKGEPTGVKIGANNTIREYTSIQRGSVGGDGLTTVGDNNYIMAYSHIAHDCIVGSSNIMANAATLAGHVLMEDFITLGGFVAIHQFTRIGSHAMIGGLSGINMDIPPYAIASGTRAKLYGLNVIGISRRGFPEETVKQLKKAYKILFREKKTLKDALKKIKTDLPELVEIKHLVEFIEKNTRGICR
jgi:UDP-N-acetylglucosamine acyltransferase